MGQTQTKLNKKIKCKRRPKNDLKEEYFIKNGGILLEKQIALSQGQHKGAGQFKVFSSQDIEKATHNYEPALIVSSCAESIVYKATLENRIVMIIIAPTQLDSDPVPNPELIDLYLIEASTLIVLNNDNMVKLYGCCLETCIPMLVYEYFSGGGLFQRLHDCNISVKWADRLRVATDIAYALSYMHNALSKPVVHRDVKSSSVVLDCPFRGKLANFASSVSITPGETRQRWPVEGTPGYIDPEYIETQEVTDKCDVYSFGVLMLELLTRRQPCLMARAGDDLVAEFISTVEKNSMMEMIDSEILEEASRDEVQRVAHLALTCVAKKGSERPTMIDVVGQLWKIQGRDRK